MENHEKKMAPHNLLVSQCSTVCQQLAGMTASLPHSEKVPGKRAIKKHYYDYLFLIH